MWHHHGSDLEKLGSCRTAVWTKEILHKDVPGNLSLNTEAGWKNNFFDNRDFTLEWNRLPKKINRFTEDLEALDTSCEVLNNGHRQKRLNQVTKWITRR
jgi:hypothetical protein